MYCVLCIICGLGESFRESLRESEQERKTEGERRGNEKCSRTGIHATSNDGHAPSRWGEKTDFRR